MSSNNFEALASIRRKRLVSIVSICFGALLIACLHFWKYRSDLETLKENYRAERSAHVSEVQKTLEQKFSFLYQAIRTMSLLPGVKKIDRYGKNFDDNAKMTVQQIYNNAFVNVKLSEIYLLPKTLDPDQIDPITKKAEEPIVTYDELIISEAKKDDSSSAEIDSGLPEEEEFEYREMKPQLEHFAQRYPTNHGMKGLEVPALIGREVITCDISEFSAEDLKNKKDEARLGIVYTVPVYSPEGTFSGGVSGVIRSNVLRSYLPETNFALVKPELNLSFSNKLTEAFNKSIVFFQQEKKNPGLIFSDQRKLGIVDGSPWFLWVAYEDSEFWNLPATKSAQTIFWVGLILIALLGGLLIWQMLTNFNLFSQISTSVLQLAQEAHSLEKNASRITSSISKLGQASGGQASAAHETASAVDEITSMVGKTADGSKSLEQIVQQSKLATGRAEGAVANMLSSMKSISQSSGTLMDEVEENNKQISEIVKVIAQIEEKAKVINDIVFQTRLLAFNASVEAARAGEHGKGFAVVAEEVGNLANMSGQSAKDITEMLQGGIEKVNNIVSNTRIKMQTATDGGKRTVEEGTRSVNVCSESLSEIVIRMNEVTEMTAQISNAIQEQEKGIQEIATSMHVFNSAAQESDKATGEVTAISGELLEQSSHLQMIVGSLSKLCDLDQGYSQTKPIEGRSDNLKVELKKFGEETRPLSRGSSKSNPLKVRKGGPFEA